MAAARRPPPLRRRGMTLLVVALALALAALPMPAHAQPQPQPQTVGDRWPEFEVPPIPEDKDGTQIRLSRIRDGYLAVNTRTDPSVTAELLIGDALATKGFTDEQVFAVQQVVGLLVRYGVMEVNAEKIAAYTGGTSTSTSAAVPAPSGAAGSASRRMEEHEHAQEHEHRRALQGCCPCVETTPGHHPKPPSSPHYNFGNGADKQQQQPQKQQQAPTAAPAPAAPAAPAPRTTTRKEKASMYRSMQAVGLALRRAAAARAFYLYLTDEDSGGLPVHSMEEFDRLSAEEQEETRAEVAGQLLLISRRYGLHGAELQVRGLMFVGGLEEGRRPSRLSLSRPFLPTTARASYIEIRGGGRRGDPGPGGCVQG